MHLVLSLKGGVAERKMAFVSVVTLESLRMLSISLLIVSHMQGKERSWLVTCYNSFQLVIKDKNFHIILCVKDNDSLLKLILADEIEHSKEICKKFDRLVTCFLFQIYKIRNFLCIFSPLNTCVGSGVNDRKVSAKT